jgi:hypothetical protein
MRKSRFTVEQMVAILREADRSSVAEVARKNKVSEQTIYVAQALRRPGAGRRQASEDVGDRERQVCFERRIPMSPAPFPR